MPLEPEKIRNVAVVGHRGTGKTSLVEAMLFQAGATNRLGTVEAGKYADFLILDANPLDDEDNYKRIHAIYQGGRKIDRAAVNQAAARAPDPE